MALEIDKLKLKMWINCPKFSYVAVILWTGWVWNVITGIECWAFWPEVGIFLSSIQIQFLSSSMTMMCLLEIASLRMHGVKIYGTMKELSQIPLHRPLTLSVEEVGDTYPILKPPNSRTSSLWFCPSVCPSEMRRLAERSYNIKKRLQGSSEDLESKSSPVIVINCVILDKSFGFEASISI